MTANSRCGEYWGVILAGGDGERLRRLTRFISGDDRPKQFCPLLEGGQTLLERTRARIAKVIHPARTLFVLTQAHEPFYSKELAGVPQERLVVQPSNRGTTAALLCTLARIAHRDKDAIVAFLPSDHYYSIERTFVQGMIKALNTAAQVRDTVILLGTKAESPETGYGYIEPGEDLLEAGSGLRRTGRFWEKPTAEVAEGLQQRGCLWNTFVMVGSVRAFFELIESAAPALHRAFKPILSDPLSEAELRTVFQKLPASDFSKEILPVSVSRTAVMDLGDIGWSDLGEPQRVITTLSEHGIHSPWCQPWQQQLALASAAG